MGDRLIIAMTDGKEIYGVGYFHYGALVGRMIGLVARIIEAFPEDANPQSEYEKYELSIDLLEAAGARIPSYELKRWEKWNFVDENEKLIHKKKRISADKSVDEQQRTGVIMLSEIGKDEVAGFQEYSVFVDISKRTINLGLRVFNKEKVREMISGYEDSEMFNDPDYLKELDVTQKELKALSFNKFLEVGETIINITKHSLQSFAKIKDEDNGSLT